MTQVALIRPGATEYDEQRRVQGVLDIPLGDRGKAEVARLADDLAGKDFTAIYCGPGEAAQRTAEAIGRAAGLRPKRLDDLRNLDLGLWQGLLVDELRRRYQRVHRQWLEDPITVCPPQGEPVDEALDRARCALKPVLRRHRGDLIALVVAEPLAQLVSALLRRDELQLDDEPATGQVEWIDVGSDILANGDGR